MWCRAWRIGYHDQEVRASAANATTNDATAPSPSRTASKLIRASAPTMSIRSTCMTLGRPIHAWMPSLELTNGAMHVYATRPSTFPHNHYHHPICESCHCQCRMITSTRAGGCMCSIFGGMYGWAVVDDRLDLIPSHPPIGRIIPLRWVLGRRSQTHGHGHGHHPCGAMHGALATMISVYVHPQLCHHQLCHRCHHHGPQADLCERPPLAFVRRA